MKKICLLMAFVLLQNVIVKSQSLFYSGSYDVYNGAIYTNKNFNTTTQNNDIRGLAFGANGTKVFIPAQEVNDRVVLQYSLTDPYDLSSVSYDGYIDVSGYEYAPECVLFNSDGSKFYVIGSNGAEINQFSLTVPYDITSGVSHDGFFSLLSYEADPTGGAFSNDGKKLFVIGREYGRVYQFSLDNAFDITSGVHYVGDYHDFSGYEVAPQSIAFNDDGSKLLVTGSGSDKVHQFDLETPFQINSGINYKGAFDVSAVDSQPMGLAFNNRGNKLFLCGNNGNQVYEFFVNPLPYSFHENETNNGGVEGALLINVQGDSFTYAGGSLSQGVDFEVHNLPADLSPEMAVSGDGSLATLTLSDSAQYHQDAHDLDSLIISFYDAAFAGGDASIINNSTNYSVKTGIDFKDNPSSIYSTAKNGEIIVHWIPSTDPDTETYRLIRTSSSGEDTYMIPRTDDGTDTLFIDTDVSNGLVYTYSLERVDGNGDKHPLFNENNTTISGFENTVPNADFGNAAYFDGDNDYIQIPDDPLLKQDQGTVEFWLRMEKNPGGTNNHYAIANKHDPNGSNNGWNFYHNLDELVFVFRDASSPYRIQSGRNLIDSTWHHVALSYDLSGNKPTVGYIDGDSIGAINLGTINISSEPITIGRSFGTWWTQFEGQIDEFRIWDHMRTQEEIAGMMKHRSDGTEEGMVMVLNLDEPDGSTLANDGSKNNLNGTVTGDVMFQYPGEDTRTPFITYSTPPDFERGLPVQESEFSLAPDVVTVADMAFSASGDKMYVIGQSWDLTFQYDLTVPFDPSTATVSATLDVSDHDALTRGITFNDTGDKLFMILGNDSIYQYNLSVPFDIGTASYSNINYNVAGVSFARDIAFGDNGRKLFVLSKTSIDQFSLAKPYDLNTVTSDLLSVDAPNFENDAKSLVLSKDGTRLFVTGKSTDLISQMNLPNAFNLKDATSSDSYYLEGEGAPSGLALSADEGKLFLTGGVNNSVFTYQLDTATFKEEDTDIGEVTGTGAIAINGEAFTHTGGQLTYGVDYTISNLPAGLIPALDVNESGNLALLTLTGSADVHNISNSLTDLIFTFENSAFSSGVANGILNATNASSHFEISFITTSQSLAILSDDSVAVEENILSNIIDVQAVEGSATADEGIGYDLVSGQDADLFNINGDNGTISFNTPPDFESPQDSNGDNLYEISVIATGSSEQVTQDLKILVLDLNDNAPVIAPDQTFTIDEDAPSGTIVGTIAVNDLDAGATFSGWTIIDGGAGFEFDIDGDGQLILTDTLDFESVSTYHFDVQVSDGKNDAAAEQLTVEVNNINEAPLLTDPINDLEFQEGFGDDEILITDHFTDPDDDALTFSAISSDPNVVSASMVEGTLLLTEAGIGNATIIITADDGLAEVQTEFNVTVNNNNVNDIPVLSVNTGLTLEKGEQATITRDMLLVTDTDNTPDELVFTVTLLPASGALFKNEVELKLNDTFTQADLNAGLISYLHNGQNQSTDKFSFQISDGQGGAISENEFEISINIILALKKDHNAELSIYPLPVSEEANIRMVNAYRGTVYIRLVDATGKELMRKTLMKETEVFMHTIKTDYLALGITYVQIMTGNEAQTRKLIKK